MKVYLSKKVSSSRLPACLPKYLLKEVVDGQVADVVVRKDRKNTTSVLYLPMDYHRQNPGYLSFMLEQVLKERQKGQENGRILVCIVVQSGEEVRYMGDVQSLCLKKDVNLMLCFEVMEVSQLIVDILEAK